MIGSISSCCKELGACVLFFVFFADISLGICCIFESWREAEILSDVLLLWDSEETIFVPTNTLSGFAVLTKSQRSEHKSYRRRVHNSDALILNFWGKMATSQTLLWATKHIYSYRGTKTTCLAQSGVNMLTYHIAIKETLPAVVCCCKKVLVPCVPCGFSWYSPHSPETLEKSQDVSVGVNIVFLWPVISPGSGWPDEKWIKLASKWKQHIGVPCCWWNKTDGFRAKFGLGLGLGA